MPQRVGRYGQWSKIGVGRSCRGARPEVQKKGGHSDESDQMAGLRLENYNYKRPAWCPLHTVRLTVHMSKAQWLLR